jgi:hypothetical protein
MSGDFRFFEGAYGIELLFFSIEKGEPPLGHDVIPDEYEFRFMFCFMHILSHTQERLQVHHSPPPQKPFVRNSTPVCFTWKMKTRD